MSVVAAYIVPGSPLPYLRPENPPWAGIAAACRAAGRSLRAVPRVLITCLETPGTGPLFPL